MIGIFTLPAVLEGYSQYMISETALPPSWKFHNHIDSLKGLAQAKIIKKSVILFRVLNMTIWCKHVHRLELQILKIFVLRIHQLG